MGFLERAIRRGVSDAVGKAIGNAVQQAVEPKATELANKAADSIDKAAQSDTQQVHNSANNTSRLEDALGNLQRSMEGYATEAAKNMKICPSCDTACTAEKKFCPKCGTKLPEITLADGAVCQNCGKQNGIGTKFCAACGTKLPAAIQEEQAAKARAEAVMAQWTEKLSHYPRWDAGGDNFEIEDYGSDTYGFSADFKGNSSAARQAVEKYRQTLLQNGFREAGQYPSKEHLYNKTDGICYHVDTEHCFDGDSDCPIICFSIGEPSGGFDYVKPEPKKSGFKNLFKF